MVGLPNKPMGFPTKNDHFGVFWGYDHLRKWFRNPANSPVEVGSFCHFFTGFYTFQDIPGGCLGFLPSVFSSETK